MNQGKPFFSVVIPAYNAERFIRMTLQSVFMQTVQDFEIVVVNDGSTDRTLEVLQGIADSRLRVVSQQNGGECVARNKGIQEARGEYIALLDSDDCWLPNHLELVLSCIKQHPDILWYVTRPNKVADIAESDLQPAPADNAHIITNWFLEVSGLPVASSSVLKREFISSIPDLFPPGIRMYGDNIGWDRLAMKDTRVCLLDTPSALYRFWEGNACSRYNGVEHGVRTEAVKAALAEYVKLWRHPQATPEARLYYRQFLLGNWWVCISYALPLEEWNDNWTAWQDITGSGNTRWMRLWSKAASLVMHAMRWGIRRRKLTILAKMEKLANKSRTRIENNFNSSCSLNSK